MYFLNCSDISQIADKTMTLSELDVSKTPGKKKKKKPESGQIGSARSEEEPSVSGTVTPKKKKKKPVEGITNNSFCIVIRNFSPKCIAHIPLAA